MSKRMTVYETVHAGTTMNETAKKINQVLNDSKLNNGYVILLLESLLFELKKRSI